MRAGPLAWRDPLLWVALAAPLPLWAALAWHGGAAGPAWIADGPGRFALLVLAYPVLEEIVFRGMIQDWLLRHLPPRRILGISGANAAASLLFALAHLPAHPPLWAAAVFVPSLVYGFFFERTRALAAPVLLHVWYNLGYFALFGM